MKGESGKPEGGAVVKVVVAVLAVVVVAICRSAGSSPVCLICTHYQLRDQAEY